MRGDLVIIADGLGFDLAAVRKMGEEVGILAAVTQARVPLANPKGQVPLDKRAIAGLHYALSTELGKVMDVAAPKVKPGQARANGSRPAHSSRCSGRTRRTR